MRSKIVSIIKNFNTTGNTCRADDENRVCSYSYFYEKLVSFDSSGLFPLSVVICDIDGLRLINDTLGPAEADKLCDFAQKLITRCVRRDDIVACTQRERFYILLPKIGAAEAELIIERILGSCKKMRDEIDSGGLCLCVSAGLATKQHEEQNIYRIIEAAEQDLYRKKQHEQKNFNRCLLKSIRKALYEKSHETEEHGERLVSQSRMLGEALGLPEDQLVRLEALATLHDIGKVSIDRAILMKPEALSEDEWEEIKKHPQTGCSIAMAVPQLKCIAQDILSHHERWDGTGYPRGLRGDDIPLLARIVSVVDAFDALTSNRCYRDAVSIEEALCEIERNAGTQFDPHIARVFVETKRRQEQS